MTTPPDVAALARAYRDDRRTLAQCGAEFGISKDTAAALLRGQGVTIRPPGRPGTAVDTAGLIRAYRDEGWPSTRCAEAFAISASAVTGILRRAGVEIRPRGRAAGRAAAHPAIVARAYAVRRRTLAQCAEEFGISRGTVAALLRGQEVTIRRKGARKAEGNAAVMARAYTVLGWSLARTGSLAG